MTGKPDIEGMQQRKDIHGLIQLLSDKKIDTQWRAAHALGQMGNDALDHIIAALKKTRHRDIRLGLIEALGDIKNTRAVPALLELLKDESIEVRWAVAIALGEIGDPMSIPGLLIALRDADKYVRYGAGISMEKVGYTPPDDEERAFLAVGKQEWEKIPPLGKAALGALTNAFRDRNADVRVRVVELLGEIGSEDSIPLMMKALRDDSPLVRWKAVLSAPRCGISHRFLPRGIARRPRVRKNPNVAAFLNFVLPGQGYNYLGFWWGLIAFQIELSLTLWMLANLEEGTVYMVLFPLYVLLAIHAWWIARRMPDL